jgi:23S rRNA (guanosine2251-2'-O)-methyltransferase
MVVLSKNRVNMDSPVIGKVSSGALQKTNIAVVSNISQFIDRIKEIGFWVYGTSENSKVSYWEPNFSESTAIIVGSEGAGLRDLTKSQCDQLLSIPMAGVVSSLNVSVACGVMLYEVLRQRSTN